MTQRHIVSDADAQYLVSVSDAVDESWCWQPWGDENILDKSRQTSSLLSWMLTVKQ